jgi:hypothetical protein
MCNKDMKPGPTGDFPDGKLSEDDDGGLAIAIAADTEKGVVIIDFGTPTSWIGLKPSDAKGFANMLIEKAVEVENG